MEITHKQGADGLHIDLHFPKAEDLIDFHHLMSKVFHAKFQKTIALARESDLPAQEWDAMSKCIELLQALTPCIETIEHLSSE